MIVVRIIYAMTAVLCIAGPLWAEYLGANLSERHGLLLGMFGLLCFVISLGGEEFKGDKS